MGPHEGLARVGGLVKVLVPFIDVQKSLKAREHADDQFSLKS